MKYPIARIRKLADRLKQWDQEWARLSLNERRSFCDALGASEEGSWTAITDAKAHWFAEHLSRHRKSSRAGIKGLVSL